MVVKRAEGQNRTDDTSIFSAVLYRLSYLGSINMLVWRVFRVKLVKRFFILFVPLRWLDAGKRASNAYQ